MTRRLSITYTHGGAQIQLFNGEVDEIVWSDGPGGVKVEGKVKKPGGTATNLFDVITKASKANTQKIIDEKREQPVD